MIEKRISFLFRRLDEDTLFFPIIVTITEDRPALFGAQVFGLDGRLAAMGRTPDEAAENAMDLFQGLVDYSLSQERPLSQELGPGIPFKRIKIRLEEATAAFSAFIESVVQKGAEWRLASAPPATALVAALA